LETTDLWTAQLDAGLAELGLAADRLQRRRLIDYLALLQKWNRVFNLSAVRDPRRMVSRHLLDSLAVLPYLHGGRILDLGTGAGLPGVPLAILSPDRTFTLIDAGAKKTRFVRQAVLELGLNNAAVIQARVETYRPGAGFDTLTARAFAPLPKILEASRHLMRSGGRLLALKGPRAAEEVAACALPPGRVRIVRLRVPDAQEARHLVVVEGF
jgi:16S rRNA (guanine527-N7)-methyltransferase